MSIADRVQVPKAGELVASQLRRQIVRGDLREGDTLPSEAVLMEHFGVSRPSLREAFRILEAEGLISVRRGARGGARVHVPEVAAVARYAGALLQYRGTTLADVYETRALLEAPAARQLARRRRRADLQQLDALLAAEEDALDDRTAFFDADEAFHLGVVELAGNKTLVLLVRMLYEIVETATASSTQAHIGKPEELDLRRRTHRSHVRLVELVRAGKATDAQAYWYEHLTTVARYLREDVTAETVVDLMA